MQFQVINRSDNETVYTAGQNVGASSLTTGQAVCLALHAASVSRGAQVFKLYGAATDDGHFYGVAAADIAPNAVGRIIVWGYCASVMISTSISNHTTIVPGEALTPGITLDGSFVSGVPPAYTAGNFKYIVNMLTVNVSTNGPTGASWTVGWLKGGL